MRSAIVWTIASAFLSGCFAASAKAATVEGITLPDTYSVEGQTLVLNGIGVRTLTVFNFDVYVAALYLPRRDQDANRILSSPGPKVILLKFIRGASKERVEKQYREGEANNCGNGQCPKSDLADFEKLVAAAPAVSAGDTSTYIFIPQGVRVLATDRPTGDLADRDLSFQLLNGFIGSHPPSPELGRALLGLPAQ